MLRPIRLIRRGLAYPIVYLAMFWAWSLIAIWGAIYLFQLFVYLQAPGIPAEYTYQTEEGDVVVRVDSYAIDPWRLAIRAWDARLTDQIGDSQFNADFITVSYRIGAVHVTANRVEGRIERLEDGSFNFDRLIPDPDEDAEPVPLRVEISEGDLTYIDLAGPTRIERSVVLTNAVLEQSGDTIVAAEASVDNSPVVPLVVFVGEDGEIWIESRFEGVDLAAFWPVIKAWVDEDNIGTWYAATATRAIATGWVRISVTEDDVLMRGSANVNAFGVYLPDLTRNAAIVGTVVLEGSRIRTQFRMADGASTVTFDGGAVFGEDIEVAGNLFHSSSRPGDLPALVRDFLPEGWDYRNASYDGYVEYGSDAWLANGEMTFSALDLGGHLFEGVTGSMFSTEDRLALDVDRAVYLEIPLAGAMQVDFVADSVAGFFDSESIALRPLLQEYGFDAFGGQTSLAVIVGGTTSAITADAVAEGDLILYFEEFDEPLALGPFQASAQLLEGVLTVQRFGLEGAYGAVTAEGTIDLVNEQIQLQIGGGGIQIESFDDETSGTVFFEADVAGTFDDPVVFARVEGYALEYADFLIPQFVANVVYSGDSVIAEQFQARVGFGYVEGAATYNLDTDEIGGAFSSSPIVVSTLADVDIIGRVRLVDGVIAGTLANPEITANLIGNNLLVFGVPVTDLSSEIYLNQGGAEFLEAQFSVEDGLVQAAGRYDFSTATLNVAGNLDNVPLSAIPFQSEQFLLSGAATGTFTAQIGDVIDNSGAANLQVSNFEVNSTPIGSGSLEVGMDGPIMTASGSIGSIDRYVLLERAEHNIDTNEVEASIVVFNFPAENLVQIFDDEIRELPGNVQAPILRTTGSISAAATIDGELENPHVEMDSLIASDIEIGGRPAGEVRASLSRGDGLWIVDSLDWRADDTVLMLSGTAVEGGEFEAVGSLSSFDLSWINVFYPEMAPVSGKANFTAMVAGTSDDIFGRASLDIGELTFVGYDGTVSEVPIRISIPDMVLQNEIVTAEGLVFFQGLPGVLTARVPISALRENGLDPLEARVVLEDRDLNSLHAYFNGIDYEQSEGSLGGFISLVGTPANFEFEGEAYLRASQLVLQGLETEFRDVDVRLDIAPEDAVLNLIATSDEGGEVFGQIIANYVNPLERGFSVQEFRDQTTISGRAEFNEFGIAERVGDAQDQSVGTIDGEVIVTGLAVAPIIDADIIASNVRVALPSEFEVGPEATALPFEPLFRNVVLRTGTPASIVTPIGNILVEGSGLVTGTLADPIVRAPLSVVGGTFRLPTARIDLQEGGSINVDYDASAGFEEPARIDVDITGLTRITARTISDLYESYEVSLNFRGNLMQDEGLRITAMSDPPGLSQDRILAIIGQQDLIEALSQSVVGGRTGDFFQEAVYSFAFPSLLGGFAEQIATSLNLDYVTIDYNPFDQAVLAAGLTLSEGLMLQVRRQLSEPRVGPLRYEIKLSYRLPVSDPNLSRIRFGIATDERVPWKITIDWGIRF